MHHSQEFNLSWNFLIFWTVQLVKKVCKRHWFVLILQHWNVVLQLTSKWLDFRFELQLIIIFYTLWLQDLLFHFWHCFASSTPLRFLSCWLSPFQFLTDFAFIYKFFYPIQGFWSWNLFFHFNICFELHH